MTYYSMARFRIKDLGQFKAELESAGDLLAKGGFLKTYINRNADDPTDIFVVHELSDLDKARHFYLLPEYKECLNKAGVIGEPEVIFMEELQAVPSLSSA